MGTTCTTVEDGLICITFEGKNNALVIIKTQQLLRRVI